MKARSTEGTGERVWASTKCRAPRPSFFAGGTEQPKADAAKGRRLREDGHHFPACLSLHVLICLVRMINPHGAGGRAQ